MDLNRFRQIAAGDRLRGQYQALSHDPNSLSNLDQDLPNSMQDQIRIHTLDPSWLWCATWCSQESLGEAKTIDLCQDPLTVRAELLCAGSNYREESLTKDAVNSTRAERAQARPSKEDPGVGGIRFVHPFLPSFSFPVILAPSASRPLTHLRSHSIPLSPAQMAKSLLSPFASLKPRSFGPGPSRLATSQTGSPRRASLPWEKWVSNRLKVERSKKRG